MGKQIRFLFVILLLGFSNLSFAVLKKGQKILITNHDDPTFKNRLALIIAVNDSENPVTYKVVTLDEKRKRITTIPKSYFKVVKSETAKPKKKNKKKNKKVNFGDEVKTHEGLEHDSYIFDEYMKEIFGVSKRLNEKQTRIVQEFANENKVENIKIILDKLEDLIKRVETNGSAPILPGGGGLGARIEAVHLPGLKEHVEYLKKVIPKVEDYWKKKQSNSSGSGGGGGGAK